MMLQTGSWHCFPFLFLLFMLHLGPILAYLLKDCTILYSDNITDGVSVDCASSDLVSVPDNLPRDVILLRLTGNIQKIHRTDFHQLSNLTYLDMSFNSITHVDDGAFVPLVQLKMLCMHNNKLTTLTDNMFQGLSNLLILSLDYNNITSINPAAFQSLPSLQELSLTPNHITDIITILQLPYLQVLSISTNELESFQTKDLPLNISSGLKELKVTSQSIKLFSITTVFPHLKTIDLSKCCNDKWEWDIPDTFFLRNITTVRLTGSSFNPIRKALESLGSLEYLQLRLEGVWMNRDLLKIICKIPTLRTLILLGGINANLSKRLSHCTRLTNLDLSHNNLTELSKNSIKNMNQLSHLNLAFNNLSTVPHDVKKLSTLQTLNLSNNNIHELNCSDFKHLTRLTHLHLDYNRVTKLEPCVFKHLNGLKVLTLIHNFIRRFGNTFKIGLHNLELLDLNKNIFYKLSKGEFNGLKMLKNLHVMVFCIRNPWENNFLEGLDELETLSLHFNKIYFKMTPSPPYKLEWQTKSTLLRRLKSLTLEVGPLYRGPDIWDMLSNMKLLEHLNMNGLVLDPNNTFKRVPQLKTLSLINCNLTSLDFLAQANLTKISWLDLSQNELTVINVSVFSFLPALRYLNIDKNPLACDCSNADFQQWMQNNNQTLVVDAQCYTCGFPLAKKGTRFLDFDYHSCWVDASFICFISSTCVIVLTLLTSFTYHFLRLHLLYAYYLFLAFLYDAKERKRGSPQCYDAFISYNVHDELWVCREMLPVLEGEQGWRLCLHHRDFLPGKPIIENITDAIYGSRKTICVISRHYLESEWCSREIQMASFRLFDEQKDVLILVFLEDIPAHQLSPHYHMRRLVKRHTYLSWSQAGQHPGLFWQNLRRALDTPLTDLGLNE